MVAGRMDDQQQRSTYDQERRSRAGKVRTVLSEKQLNILKTCFRLFLFVASLATECSAFFMLTVLTHK